MRTGQSAGTGFIGRQNAAIVVVLLIPTAQLLHRSIDVVSSNAAESMPVVSKNTNELKTHAPGRFGLEVSRLGCAFYLFIRQPHGSEVSPAARNTLDFARIPRASKLLICGLFQKGRVLAQDGIVLWSRLARPSAADNAQLRSGHEHRIHLLTPLRYLVRMNRR